ncbi:hypothetical protein DMR_31910 [Solidesulfovibrio magneticus RS-1]|uniref:Uncharacterized protein n=1 Tax=Solidesulfovibrio magneticus (strain ATCC 700980 / DSM 13731 / RS-1) TaxID=573370 RepID=C4XJD2_SOLM1|nr:hypothetical protein DMR_31910 [Solidesulfovibrio magneticus RS-1]
MACCGKLDENLSQTSATIKFRDCKSVLMNGRQTNFKVKNEAGIRNQCPPPCKSILNLLKQPN